MYIYINLVCMMIEQYEVWADVLKLSNNEHAIQKCEACFTAFSSTSYFSAKHTLPRLRPSQRVDYDD
jgi:hypothetical protein